MTNGLILADQMHPELCYLCWLLIDMTRPWLSIAPEEGRGSAE